MNTKKLTTIATEANHQHANDQPMTASTSTPKAKSKKRGGRPDVDLDNRKSVVLTTRMTPHDAQSVICRATSAGVSISSFLHSAALGKAVARKTKAKPEGYVELALQLSKVGNNLNQIAKIANTTKRVPPELKHTLKLLDDVLTDIMNLK